MKNCGKAVISVILCVLIVFSLSSAALALGEPLRLTVAADTHFQCFDDLAEFPTEQDYTEGMIDSDLYYYATTQGQMNYESNAIVKQLLASFVHGDDDYLLIAGDLTCGKRRSHLEFARLLREAEEQSGKEIFVICGNHDCDDDDFEKYIGIDEFKEIYADFGYSQALSRHESSGSYTAELSDKYRLIAIDSCIYGKDDGKIGSSVMKWIERQAAAAKADGKKLVGMMHHSAVPHFYVQPMAEGYASAADKLADMGIDLVFTGHIHANDISSAKTKSGKMIYDVQTGSLITSPNAYRHVELGGKIEITSEYITEIDTGDLPDGYGPEQRAAIERDFAEYSYGFFEAGMCRWLNRYIGSAGKLGKLLKLDPDSAAYKELDELLRVVGSSINLPIYDDGSTPGVLDSIEEIAASAGYALPKSGYERIYQIVAALMGNFFRGDGCGSSLDAEAALLLDCVKAGLAHCAVNIACGGKLNELLSFAGIDTPKDRLITAAARLNYADKLSNALVAPLLQGISSDYSEPSDTAATIDLNSADLGGTAPIGSFAVAARYLKDFIKALGAAARRQG